MRNEKIGVPANNTPETIDHDSSNRNQKKRKSIIEQMAEWNAHEQTPEKQKADLNAHMKSQYAFDRRNTRFRGTGIEIERQGFPTMRFHENPIRSNVTEDMPISSTRAGIVNQDIRARLALWDMSLKGMYLYGGPSTGKRTEVYMLKKRIESEMKLHAQKHKSTKPFKIIFGAESDLIESVEKSLNSNIFDGAMRQISALWRAADLLFITGFGNVPSDFKVRESYFNLLMGILNERSKGFQAVKLKTFFTSTLKPNAISDKFRPEIFDRIQGVCNFVEMTNTESLRGIEYEATKS